MSYFLLCKGWDVSDHLGDGYDLIAEKTGKFIKIELKAVDLTNIKAGNNATQKLSANEISAATHLVITIFQGIEAKCNFIMTIKQFVESSGVKKYEYYGDFGEFIAEYRKLSEEKSKRVKNATADSNRLDFDFSFNPESIEQWKFAIFKEKWGNLDL